MENNALKKEAFNDVIVFSVSEPGAMGPNDMTFYKANGESFTVDYKKDETPYSLLKELFPILKDCYWDGPMKNESAYTSTLVIGGSPDDKETCVAEGWRHIYLDFGNHIAVKTEFYSAIKEIFSGIENCDITYKWTSILNDKHFSENIDNIRVAYFEQKKADEHLAKVLTELKQNPDYIRKVKEAKGDMDKMMQVLEEFSGIKMTWFELKQFGFRQIGLI